MGACPGESHVLGFVRRSLSGDEARAVEEHLDRCPDCRQLVAALAADSLAASPEMASTLEDGGVRERSLDAGETVGRYRVESVIGAGAMGIVYAAWDPELARRVALKLLHPRRDRLATDELEVRLRREAQSVARVSHENVVAIHDVGRHGAQLFIAMEFVDGTTLRRWLAAAARPRGEILDRFLQAGRGLQAAHRAGLVHRDFKPDNVLVAGDGRVKVGDFGLARVVDEPSEPGRKLGGDVAVTRTGSLVGTPAYMAPEQFDAGAITARTDVFAFCVALHEALYGERPFAGGTVEELARAVRTGAVRPPRALARVPGRLRRIVLRGLAPDPAGRWPSMEALLGALGRARSLRARLLRAGAIAAFALCVAAVAAGVAASRSGARRELCRGAERKLAGVWDDERRATVERAFAATAKPYARPGAAAVRRALDAWADRFVRVHTESCEATRLRGERSEELLELSLLCLDGRRREAEQLVALLARPDDGLIQNGGQLAAALSSPEPCTDAKALRTRLGPPKDTAAREKLAEARAALSANRARILAGRYREAVPVAEEALAAARPARYRPLEAEALLQLGQAKSSLNDQAGAERALREAIESAHAGGDDEVVAMAQAQLVFQVGYRGQRFAEAHAVAKEGHITLERLGGDAAMEGSLRSNEATVYAAEGKHDEAVRELTRALSLHERVAKDHPNNLAMTLVNLGKEHLLLGQPARSLELEERALKVQEEALGKEHLELAITLEHMGNALGALGRGEEALERNRRALAIREAVLGEAHPDVGVAWGGVAYALAGLLRHAEAVEANQRSLAILEAAYGPSHVELATTLVNLGEELRALGRFAEARAAFVRSEAIMVKELGPDHPNLAYPWVDLGAEAYDRGAYREALGWYQRALGRFEKAMGADNPNLASLCDMIGASLLNLGRAREAGPHFERGRRLTAAAHGEDGPEMAEPIGGLADVKIALGAPAEAVPLLERALALREKAKLRPPGDTGGLKLSLATALVRMRRDPARARRLAEEAVREIALTGPAGVRDLARARRLLASLK